MKNYLGQNKAITLIALVITIIVLLILAGVAVVSLTGDNGLLGRAIDARNMNEYAELDEEAKLVLLNRKMDTEEGSQTLKEALEQQISGNKEVTAVEGITDMCYVKRGNTEITVYEDGEVFEGKTEIWDGSTIECPVFKTENNSFNWYIYRPGQLKFLSDFVNNGNSITGTVDLTSYITEYNASDIIMTVDTTIYLMDNLDLGARQKNGTLISGKSWNPIGTDSNNVKDKLGTFDGKDYTIRGVYINSNENNIGIFANSNFIQNLTVKNSYIKGKNGVGGITGRAYKKVFNCKNVNTYVVGQCYVGRNCWGC